MTDRFPPRRAALALCAVLATAPAQAAQIGDWEQTCGAQNLKTGTLETVPEITVENTFDRLARIVPTEDGGWVIHYNIGLMKQDGVQDNPNVRKFLFYRECAKAQYRTDSDVTADCVAISRMKTDASVARDWVQSVRTAYRNRGRRFPTGFCTQY